MNEGREEKSLVNGWKEVIISHTWGDNVLTLIKKSEDRISRLSGDSF